MKSFLTRIILLSFLLAFITANPLQAATERRLALVIGNGKYASSPLRNPVNDATDMAAALKNLGFTVILKTNAGRREMGEAVEDFGRRLKGRDVGLFYYAGHGVQVNGVNYLIPVGAKIGEETDMEYEAIDAGRILAGMHNAKSRVNIVILDACRDNPYSRSFRSATRGLAIIARAPTGTIISYSTSLGDVALDGKGRNSPYTASLLHYVKEPGLGIEQVFKNVRQKLNRETNGRQIPWELSSLQGDFFFAAGAAGKAAGKDEIKTDQGKEPQMGETQKAGESGAPSSFEDLKMKMEERRREEGEWVRNFEAAKQMEADSPGMDEKIQVWKQLLASLPTDRTAKGDEIRRYAGARVENLERWKALGKTPPREVKNDGRFTAYDDGTVLDGRTGLMWAAEDNGAHINRQDAGSYCENYRGGGYTDWRLPTQDELAGLYDRGAGYTPRCAGSNDTDKVHLTGLITLSCWAEWASETRGSDNALFYFLHGNRGWSIHSADLSSSRVLPVRSGK